MEACPYCTYPHLDPKAGCCDAISPVGIPWECTRPANHPGAHVACSVTKPCLSFWLAADDEATL